MTVLETGSKTYEIELPDERVARQAGDAAVRLAALLEEGDSPPVRLVSDNGAEGSSEVDVPAAAMRYLVEVLTELSKGNAVMVDSLQPEVSVMQASGMLGVSEPYLTGLLDEGKIPYREVDGRRKVPLLELLDYKRRDRAYRREMMRQLTQRAQLLGFYE